MKLLYKETKWLQFFIVDRKPKTVLIEVRNTANSLLGKIYWRGAWRKYIFSPYPHAEIIFDCGCLQDIIDVLNTLTAAHKKGESL